MASLFTATDPLGRVIALEESQWRQHICVEHPGLQPEWIARCLTAPDFVARDAIHARRRVFYKRNYLPGRSIRRFYLKVVVELSTEEGDPAHVITAYIASEAKIGEELEWPIRSN